MGGSGIWVGRVVDVEVDSSNWGAEVGFAPSGVEVVSIVLVPFSEGVNEAINNSPPGRLLGKSEF